MNQEKKITYHATPLWVGLVIFVGLCCAALGYYYFSTSSNNQKRKAQVTASNRGMDATVAKLTAEFSDQKTEIARKNAENIRDGMMTDAEADAFIASLRPTWSVVSRTQEDNGDFLRYRYQIVRGSAPVSVWPEVISLVERMQGMQALAVNNVDVQTVGDSRKREFSRITFSFSVYVKKNS